MVEAVSTQQASHAATCSVEGAVGFRLRGYSLARSAMSEQNRSVLRNLKSLSFTFIDISIECEPC